MDLKVKAKNMCQRNGLNGSQCKKGNGLTSGSSESMDHCEGAKNFLLDAL